VPRTPEGQAKRLAYRYMPQIEKPEYVQMYEFYESLGKARSYSKVASQFSKSKSFIALIARNFSWKHRVTAAEKKPEDTVVTETKGQVDEARRKLVAVVNDVVDTLYELMFVAKDAKRGRVTEENEARAAQLMRSLAIWGFTWKSPSQFRQLITTLKEIIIFNEGPKSGGGQKIINPTQTNIEKFELHITDE
jgi:hypothetical protein